MRQRIDEKVVQGLSATDALAAVMADLNVDPLEQLRGTMRAAFDSQNANGKRPAAESIAEQIRAVTAAALDEPVGDAVGMLVDLCHVPVGGSPPAVAPLDLREPDDQREVGFSIG